MIFSVLAITELPTISAIPPNASELRNQPTPFCVSLLSETPEPTRSSPCTVSGERADAATRAAAPGRRPSSPRPDQVELVLLVEQLLRRREVEDGDRRLPIDPDRTERCPGPLLWTGPLATRP